MIVGDTKPEIERIFDQMSSKLRMEEQCLQVEERFNKSCKLRKVEMVIMFECNI